MAGYVFRETIPEVKVVSEFRMGKPDLAKWIREEASHPRVITMQLDGHELEAALWGLENYKKG